MDPILISVVAFVGVTALVTAIAFAVRDMGSTTAEDRLAVITGQKSAGDENKGVMKEEMFKEGISGIQGMFNRMIGRLMNLQLLFEQADSPIKPNVFFGISGLLCLLGVAGAVIGNAPVPLYPVAGIIAAFLPLGWMLFRRSVRFKKFGSQLPDALELIARALRSGHSLNGGLSVVVDEMPSPISDEFGLAYEEQNLGVPIETALKNMLKRMPNMDLKFFVTAVAIQKQAGGDMAEILDKIGRIIRERFKILGQVQALTGEGRISGIVLMALPIALFVAVYYLNPPYVMLLFTEELGRQMIAGAAVLQVLGAICIKKIIAIKV